MAGGDKEQGANTSEVVVIPAPEGVPMVEYEGVVMSVPLMHALMEQEQKAG